MSSTVGRSASQASIMRSAVSGFVSASRCTAHRTPAKRLKRKLLVKPITWKLGSSESVPAVGCAKVPLLPRSFCAQFHRRPACVRGTPLGAEVEPDVNMMSASEPGATATWPSAGSDSSRCTPSTAGSSDAPSSAEASGGRCSQNTWGPWAPPRRLRASAQKMGDARSAPGASAVFIIDSSISIGCLQLSWTATAPSHIIAVE